MSAENLFEGVPVIFAYTRAQAIEDGVLIDVTEKAQELGFKHHTVVTQGVWSECVALTEAAKKACNDERGRLHDVLWMAACATRGMVGKMEDDRVYFSVLSITDNPRKPEKINLWMMCGPGDDAEPVITIMLEGED
jgi:hypothetical protein